ncbi:MAG: hypothetical protein OHK0038_19280 [Flammeovirgaceae bacterium]
MKKINLLFLSVLVASIIVKKSYATAPEKLNLYKAVQEKIINIKATSKGGYFGEVLELSLTNITKKNQTIEIEAGTWFDSEEDYMQDLLVLKSLEVKLTPSTTSSVVLTTACTQSGNSSPSITSTYQLKAKAEGDLLALVKKIDEKKYYQYSSVQSAIWAIINKTGIEGIYGEVPDMVKDICEIVSKATGKPCTENNYKPRPHRITNISSSMEVYVTDYLKNTSLKAYDNRGVVRQVYFSNQDYKPGFYQFKIGIYHNEDSASTFDLRFEENGKVIAQKTLTPQDTIVRMRKLDQENTLTFELKKAIKARVGIYDEQDSLYILLSDNQHFSAGFHKLDFLGAKREIPFGKQYFFKIKEGETTIHQSPFYLDNKKDQLKYSPITRRGTFICNLKEDVQKAKLAVYDQEGQVVWVVFSDSDLRKGGKNFPYVFQHRYGADYFFFIKLTDKEGNVIKEEKIRGKK